MCQPVFSLQCSVDIILKYAIVHSLLGEDMNAFACRISPFYCAPHYEELGAAGRAKFITDNR